MYKNNLHRQLHRQIKKNFTDQFILENESVQKFIDVINQSYLNYEKDAELSEQSSNLDGIEYSHINQKLKEELDKKENFQIKLIEAIKQLSNIEIELGNKVGLIDLLQILDEEIISRKKFQEELFNAKLIAEKANEAKSDFLSIMSHEIRTPLNAIIGLIYIMEKENTIESFHENLGVLKHSAQNLFQVPSSVESDSLLHR